jgi:hypothetical protein
VSADYFRVGAQDHLRAYAGLLGVDFFTLEAEQSLRDLHPKLRHKRLVIIDTAGMGQWDTRLALQMAQLSGMGRPVEYVLLLNAAAHAESLESTAVAYREAARANGSTIRRAILTKLDESPGIGTVLGVAMRHSLRIDFISDGQRVPEDFHGADPHDLIQRAMSAQVMSDATLPSRREDALTRSLELNSTLRMLRLHAPGFRDLERNLRHGRALQDVTGQEAAGVVWLKRGRQLQAVALDDEWLPLTAGAPAERADRDTIIRDQCLSRPPDARRWFSLLDDDRIWAASVPQGLEVWFQGHRRKVGHLRALGQVRSTDATRFKGRSIQLRLSVLPVGLWPISHGRFGALGDIWFGEIVA